MFFNFTNLFLTKFVKWLRIKPVFGGFLRLFGYLLNEINIYYVQLYRSLTIYTTAANKPCLEALLNDLFDPIGRNITIESRVGVRNINEPYAYPQIFIPPTQLNTTFFPSDLAYIKEIVNKLIPYGIRPSAAEIVTAYTIAIEVEGVSFTLAAEDTNGSPKAIAFFQNIEANKKLRSKKI